MGKKTLLVILFSAGLFSLVSAQISLNNDSIPKRKEPGLDTEMRYDVGNGKTLIYSKPGNFGFIRNLPKDAATIATTIGKKESVKPLLLIAASTGLLILADQPIINGVDKFSNKIGIHGHERNVNLLNFKLGDRDVSLFRLPANINTLFYQIGQGFPSLMIGAGLYTYGKIKTDYRALSTASQLAESFILMGVGTQLVKRITGRQSPSEATISAGHWDFFPSFSQYQNYTPNYDAFPSGHLATLMSSLTIFVENYPEKKWIKPVGYSITGLVALSMINNKVHWASDYPLAIGMGYLCAKTVSKRNRRVETSSRSKKRRGELDYTLNYLQGRLMPGVVYKF